MIGRPVALAGLLGAAVGGPYVMSNPPEGWSNPWGGAAATQEESADPQHGFAHPAAPDMSAPRGPGSEIYESPAQLGGPVGVPLEQALNWNIDRNWVYRNWARKSTGLADPTMFGVRVPLVTGSGMTDVAGSLTYYFDSQGVLQRMRLRGRTADTSRVVHLATTSFGMQQRKSPTPGDQLFQSVEGSLLRGEFRTRPESVLWATSPHSSFEVVLEVTRPGSDYYVTTHVPRLEIPGAPSAAPTPPTGADPEGGSPVLPHRAVVPDAEAPAAATAAEEQAAPKPPPIGGPTKAPAPTLKPLDGHRDRFRWPG